MMMRALVYCPFAIVGGPLRGGENYPVRFPKIRQTYVATIKFLVYIMHGMKWSYKNFFKIFLSTGHK